MSRRNHVKRRPQARRRAEGVPSVKPNRRLTRVPIEEMVVPVGRCYFRSRHGKLRFTKDEIDKALKHAQRNRAAKGSTHVEERYYPCPEGGCGDFHLTSRTEYTPRNARQTGDPS